jgi:DNA polymerase-3 subunit epsilon
MYTVFDCETTGLPLSNKAKITDLNNWPRVIQLAWAFFDKNGDLLESKVDLIKPDGWKIPTEKFWIDNGFSQKYSEDNGIPLIKSLEAFKEKLEISECLIAHNMAFDYNVVGAEFLRLGLTSNNKPKKICTKDSSVGFCKLPSLRGGYKWPKLEELHKKLFNCGFEGAHDALVDVEACGRCFFELRRLGVIKDF